MRKTDVKTKEYVRRPTVFADLFNHLLYDGKQKIKPEDLAELDPTDFAVLKDRDGREYAVQKYRDVLKRAVVMEDESAVYLLILGVENQTRIHYAMSVRNMLYDALNYSSQVADIARQHREAKEWDTGDEFLSGFHKDDFLIPVVTLVVHFGQEPWDGAMNLHSMFRLEDGGILRFIPDYRINLISPVSMSDEEIQKFRSDFRELAAYMRCGRDKEKLKDLVESNEAYKHMDPLTAGIASDVTNSKLKLKTNEKGEVDMCVAIAGIREEGRHEGMIEGIEFIRKLKAQGREEDVDRVLVDAAYRDKLIGEMYNQSKVKTQDE